MGDKTYTEVGYVKYNKADFLDYASAFDYSEDFLYQSQDDNGEPTITLDQAIDMDIQYHKDMKKWKLKEWYSHFGFVYKDNGNGGESMTKPYKHLMASYISKNNK
jgi:hypothetical protein